MFCLWTFHWCDYVRAPFLPGCDGRDGAMELEKKTAVVICPKTADQGLQGPAREKRGGWFSPLGKDGRY